MINSNSLIFSVRRATVHGSQDVLSMETPGMLRDGTGERGGQMLDVGAGTHQ